MGRFQLAVVAAMVTKSPRFLPPQQPEEHPSVGHAPQVAQGRPKGWADVTHGLELLPHPTLLNPVIIAIQVEP